MTLSFVVRIYFLVVITHTYKYLVQILHVHNLSTGTYYVYIKSGRIHFKSGQILSKVVEYNNSTHLASTSTSVLI